MNNNIIMNENRFVEDEIMTNNIDIGHCKPYDAIKYMSLWIRYLVQNTEMTKAEIWKESDSYLSKRLEIYNKFKWRNIIENAYDKGNDYPLHDIDTIPITQHEMDCLIKLKGIMTQKVMFTLLVLSKFYNLINKENNGWCNTDHKNIKKLANFSANMDKYYETINHLHQSNLVQLTIKTCNIKIDYSVFVQLNTETDNNEIAFEVTDMSDLGFLYMLHHKRYAKNVGTCKSCGTLFYRSAHNTCYCKNCKKY